MLAPSTRGDVLEGEGVLRRPCRMEKSIRSPRDSRISPGSSDERTKPETVVEASVRIAPSAGLSMETTGTCGGCMATETAAVEMFMAKSAAETVRDAGTLLQALHYFATRAG